MAGFKVQLAARLKKAALDLYDFVGAPEGKDLDKYLTAIAHLIDVSATEAEQEMTGLKRTIGGLTAKVTAQASEISALKSDLAVKSAQLDKVKNDASPAVGMAARYEG